jgi:hypothetical protein
MKVYSVFRKIHLYSGLAILAFLTMYFLTGYVMIHDWFYRPTPGKTTRTEQLFHAGPQEPAAYSNYLQRTFSLRGKVTEQRQLEDGSWRFRYFRPGTLYEAIVAPAGDRVWITTQNENAVDTMIGVHRLHGYGGGNLYNLWAFLYDLASFSLIVFAFTGIYLWYKLTKKRLLGWIVVGISYGYAAVTILYLMYAP